MWMGRSLPYDWAMAISRSANWLLVLALLAISPSAFAQSAQNLVGFWWKPTESGWGLTIQQQGTSTFAVWFTYDPQGAATFYTLQCAFSGSTCAGDLYTYRGTPLLQITGSANTTPIKVGTGNLTVTGSRRLSFAYTIGTVTQAKTDLEPQDFKAPAQVPRCTLEPLTGTNPRAGLTNYTDHWWGGPDASGWGLQISHQGDTVFAGWYSYNAQGAASWMTAQGTQDPANPRRITGLLYVVDPGIPFSSITGPVPQSSIRAVGSFELNFTSGERGTFSWSIPVSPFEPPAARSMAIERFAIAGGSLNACTVAPIGGPSTVSGKVVASQDAAAPVAGARIIDSRTGAVLATADAAGNFRIDTPSGDALRVSITADGYLTRESGLQPGTQGVVADIIRLSPPFSLAYYRQLVRPGFDGNSSSQGFGLQGWRGETMNVYLRTNLLDPTDHTRAPVDTGVAVSPLAVERVLGGLEKTLAQITGGTVAIGRVESGPLAAHQNEPGWLAVEFFDSVRHPQDYIGTAGSGADGTSGWVRLGHGTSVLTPSPGAPMIDCTPLHEGLAMHELGHVLGLSHAELDVPNVMLRAGGFVPCAEAHFSPAERLHGRIAFSRPRGNLDPDRDPAGFVLPGRPR